MRTDLLIKTFHAPVAVAGYLLVTPGADDSEVAAADAATDPLIGVTTQIGTQANGRCDVVMGGVTEVVAGGAVSRGASLTSDSSGRAVAVGATASRTIGIALTAAAQAGDIISILIAPGINPATAG